MFYYFLKEIYPHRNKQRKFLNLLETFIVPSAFNNISTATDNNFKATELKVIPHYCIAIPYCARLLRHWHPQMSACTPVHNERNFPQAKIDDEMFLFF